jgi:hypothetical protein
VGDAHTVRVLQTQHPRKLPFGALGTAEPLVPLRRTETPIGTHTAAVHAFEHSIVRQIPIDDEMGCTISMNPDVGSNVVAFVEDCRAELGQ